MDEKKTTFEVTYTCGCVSEIEQDKSGGVAVFKGLGIKKSCGSTH